jgi:PIN domain nuclease of toxin-antitoxin system
MIILDTCAFIWLGLQGDSLSPAAVKAIQSESLAISGITLLEIGYLIRKRKLVVDCTSADFSNLVLEANDVEVIPLTPEIVEKALSLPQEINNDPADRIISATAMLNGAAVVTSDANLRQSDLVDTIW